MNTSREIRGPEALGGQIRAGGLIAEFPVDTYHFSTLLNKSSEVGQEEPPGPYLFRRRGRYREIAYEGPSILRRDTTGFKQIAILLAQPGVPLACLKLQQRAGLTSKPPDLPIGMCDFGLYSGNKSVTANSHNCGNIHELADLQSIKEIRAAKVRLEKEYEKCIEDNETQAAAQKNEEIEKLDLHLRSVCAWNGRPRQGKTPHETARNTTSKAIHRAMQYLEEEYPALCEHLRDFLALGIECVYQPKKAISWMT